MTDTSTLTTNSASPDPAPLTVSGPRDWAHAVPPQQVVLVLILLLEIVVFGLIGRRFFTLDNFFGVARLNTELALLALALTPVILTGGIDLSVGSLLGLSAILFGKLCQDGGLPPWLAAAVTLAVGALAGGLNGTLITRLRIPPLIVTLGTFSLFRGIAEGITGGKVVYTEFPGSFFFLGRGSVGPVPTQLLVLVPVAVAFYLLVHRSKVGRALSAIGFSPEGARHAGIRVERQVCLAYVLSGACAALASVIYVARIGEARASAGVDYELLAITAVVLGGTSIFGGRGTVIGSLLGLAAVAILENGLWLTSIPLLGVTSVQAEWARVLTGVLLLVAIGVDWKAGRANGARAARHPVASTHSTQPGSEEFEMRNSQLAVLSAVILASALIVAGANFLLVRSLVPTPPRAESVTVGMMPKSLGNSYFIACQKGAQEAAKELNVELLWNGPASSDAAKQNEIVDTWRTRGVDVIAAAVENKEGLSTALREAQKKGIRTVTWDADAATDARAFFVNQATPEGIGRTLMDTAAKHMENKGEFAIITGSLTAANLNEWRKHVEARLAEKYPDIKLLETVPCDDKQDEAFQQAKLLLNKHPNLKLILAVCSPAVPGAAEAVKQSGKPVSVVGLGLPNDNKKYVHDGVTKAVILWKTADLGYLTVHASAALARGELKPGDKVFKAGRLGEIPIQGDNIVLGEPFVFTKENIDQFDF